jgi:hypothetical protein
MSQVSNKPYEHEDERSRFARLRERAPAHGIVIADRAESNLVMVVGRGRWGSEMLVGHFREIDSVLRAKRARFGSARILCDLRDQAVHSPEILDQLRTGIARTYLPTDRVAALVASSLAKMELRQRYNGSSGQFFTSIDAAWIWLDAYS